MSSKPAFSSLRLTRLALNKRFALLLGGMTALAFVLFFAYGRYSVGLTKAEFQKRGVLLSETMAQESVFGLLMQDTEGLGERLGNVVDGGTALAGGFGPDGEPLVDNALTDRFRKADLALDADADADAEDEAPVTRWVETKSGEAALISVARVFKPNSEELLGYVVTALPAATIQAQERAGLISSLLTPAVLALLAGLILVLVRRTVVAPVDRLRKAAVAVENGDLSVRVDVKQEDEIGQLAASFNAMVEASERSAHAIQEQTEQAEAAREQAEGLQAQADEERRYLQTQFEKISQVVVAVTRGDLTQRLTVPNDDDVGRLMRQVNQMIDDLEGLIGEVHETSDSLSSAAHQVASAAEQMSAGAHAQASQTGEVAAAIEEMSATVGESSRNAFEANQMAKRASELAANKVTALGESGAQIGAIIQVIGDIADQTNLLALNAAIEAARAGEQGRGFAVVADEVRKLAERTTAATKEIGAMITRIQRNTEEVVTSMTRGNEEVESGLRLADNASESLSEIVGSINNMVLMIDQIAAASQEQTAASSMISQNVEAISAVSTEVSEATGELALTADGMTRQSATLRQIIDRFQIRQHMAPVVPGSVAPRQDEASFGSGDGAPFLATHR